MCIRDRNYKIVVYLTGFDGNNASYITDGTSTYYWDPKAFSKDLTLTTQSTYETGTTATKANVAVFGSEDAPLTASTVTLNFGLAPGATGGGGIGGFQIIEVPAPDNPLAPLQLTLVRNGENYDLSWNSREGMIYDLLSSSELSELPPTNWNVHLEALTITAVSLPPEREPIS